MMNRHSSIAHAAYQDLLRSLLDEQTFEIRGVPHLETRHNRRYWYDMYRVGTSVRKRYIGEDTPEMAERIARHRSAEDARAHRRSLRSRLIRVLRAEGFQTTDPGTGSLLSTLANCGVFRLGGTLVGTQAFRMYEGELGVRIGQTNMLQTDDLDIAQFERLSLAIDDRADPPLPETFRELDFQPQAALGSTWRWKQTKSETLVEFLTPSFRPEEDIRELPALGVAAQSLHFLNYLIADPIKGAALYRSGVLVQIPRPERFAIHKLIVADRRRGGPDALKSVKDRAQAAFLIRALAEDRPDELREARDEAMENGAKWRDRIGASLRRMPETAALLDGL